MLLAYSLLRNSRCLCLLIFRSFRIATFLLAHQHLFIFSKFRHSKARRVLKNFKEFWQQTCFWYNLHLGGFNLFNQLAYSLHFCPLVLEIASIIFTDINFFILRWQNYCKRP